MFKNYCRFLWTKSEYNIKNDVNGNFDFKDFIGPDLSPCKNLTVSTFETLVKYHETMWRNIPKKNFYSRRDYFRSLALLTPSGYFYVHLLTFWRFYLCFDPPIRRKETNSSSVKRAVFHVFALLQVAVSRREVEFCTFCMNYILA